MAKKRKTIDVDDVRIKANDLLRLSKDELVDRRNGIIVLLEDILFKTGNYSGFRYLNEDDMKDTGNQSVGIRRNVSVANQFDDTDRTRVEYY